MVRSEDRDPVGHRWSDADFIGGHPSLDFINTVADTGKTRSRDKLDSWQAVHSWARKSQILSNAELKRFLADLSLDGAADLAGLQRFRETAYVRLVALLESKPMDLEDLEAPIRRAIERGSIKLDEKRLQWRPDPGTRHRWVDAAALSLEQLLRSGDLARLRQCARCTWLFLDHGRGIGRRWCDMRTCGNRAKAEAFRSR